MIDTCQATTMYSKFYSPNILATGSSQLGENSYSVCSRNLFLGVDLLNDTFKPVRERPWPWYICHRHLYPLCARIHGGYQQNKSNFHGRLGQQLYSRNIHKYLAFSSVRYLWTSEDSLQCWCPFRSVQPSTRENINHRLFWRRCTSWSGFGRGLKPTQLRACYGPGDNGATFCIPWNSFFTTQLHRLYVQPCRQARGLLELAQGMGWTGADRDPGFIRCNS